MALPAEVSALAFKGSCSGRRKKRICRLSLVNLLDAKVQLFDAQAVGYIRGTQA